VYVAHAGADVVLLCSNVLLVTMVTDS